MGWFDGWFSGTSTGQQQPQGILGGSSGSAFYAGATPTWADKLAILGAALQDIGAGLDGKPSDKAEGLRKRVKTQRAEDAYATMVNNLFGSKEQLNPVTITPSMQDQSFTPEMRQAAYNAPAMETVKGPMADSALSPFISQLPMEMGWPLMAEALKPKDPVKVGLEERLVNPLTGKEIVGAAANPNKPFNPDGTPNQAFINYELMKAQAGRSLTTNNIALNTEKGYAGAMAEQLAKQDAAILDAGRSAPQRIQTAQTVLNLIDTGSPITGFGAEQRLTIQKALGMDTKQVADTETLMAMLNKTTLDAIKTSGLGSGQGFTDKDRQFLQDASSGRITWNSETIRRAAHLAEKAGFATINASNRVANRLKGNPTFGSVGQDLYVNAPKSYGPRRTPSIMPNAPAAPVPPGVDPNVWQHMTPQERALWK